MKFQYIVLILLKSSYSILCCSKNINKIWFGIVYTSCQLSFFYDLIKHILVSVVIVSLMNTFIILSAVMFGGIMGSWEAKKKSSGPRGAPRSVSKLS